MSLMFTGLPRHPPFAELSDELRDFSRCTGLPRYLADARHPSCPSPDSNREPSAPEADASASWARGALVGVAHRAMCQRRRRGSPVAGRGFLHRDQARCPGTRFPHGIAHVPVRSLQDFSLRHIRRSR